MDSSGDTFRATGPDPVEPPLDDDIALLQELFRLLADRADELTGYFYATLFLENPALREMFPAAMDAQRARLFRGLTAAVESLGQPDELVPMLRTLGRDHRKFGVRAEHYEAFGRALLVALRRYGDDVWVPELETAWNRAYSYVAAAMIDGAREAARTQPAWWRARIVAHERRADDIAVLTLRPDRPYDYRAGQYASVETPYRPRSWRTYSMATAPSPDGLLEFHVRAVGAGLVSGPLVWRAAVGDELTLGPPMGELAIDKQSRRDVLAVAGGTGLAPIKALVDEMTRWNTARRVTLFFGVRRAYELYDLAALQRVAGLNPWLRVVPCTSDDPYFSGEQGTLPDVVARHGAWSDHDVLVCGSPAMTRATLTRLREIGVPPERVRCDMMAEGDPAAQVIDLREGRARRTRRARAAPTRSGR